MGQVTKVLKKHGWHCHVVGFSFREKGSRPAVHLYLLEAAEKIF